MRHTVDYRSALVMAAALGGSALAQGASARSAAEGYWRQAEAAAYRRTVAQPYLRERIPGPSRGAHESRVD